MLHLNDRQLRAITQLSKFLEDPISSNFLLLGPAGSGKTTVVTTAHNKTKKRVAFCAFTNKATSVLKNITKKFKLTFQADFLTIHSLLRLETYYLHDEHQVRYRYRRDKIEYLRQYDIIIFDECSTISSELYGFLVQTKEHIAFRYDHRIKYVFLGDYWQLPPVGELNSAVFAAAREERWRVSRLKDIMRSNNDNIRAINQNLVNWCDAFRDPNKHLDQLNSYVEKYPYNMVADRSCYAHDLSEFLFSYLDEWTVNPDVVMLSYSRDNCRKSNYAIQDILDTRANREVPHDRHDKLIFHPGDRCVIDKPIHVLHVIDKTIPVYNDTLQQYVDTPVVQVGDSTGVTLYNGDIFDVIQVRDVRARTVLNIREHVAEYFNAQLLTITRVGDEDHVEHSVIHIDRQELDAARRQLYADVGKTMYLEIMSGFIKYYPKLDYGYCISVYKAQGSEWRTVLINMSSIKYCMVGAGIDGTFSKFKSLFRATNTAISRAADKLLLFWIT